MREEIPDLMIDRAVEVWCRALGAPKFDNGDDSENGVMGMGLAAMLANTTRKADHLEAIERFRSILSRNLKEVRDKEGQRIPGDEDRTYWLNTHLSTDYHPCGELSDAADEAGIDASQFSIKSSVFFARDYVSTSFGYAAPSTYHYPLEGGGWLITQCRLEGDDKEKIIAAALDGTLKMNLEFPSEKSEAA